MYEIDTGESNRMKKIKEEIQKAMAATVANIEAYAARVAKEVDGKKVPIDTRLMTEAKQLVNVYKVLFPNDTTNGDVKKIDTAIKALKPEIAALLG
jgi:hypothetical protein